MENWYRGYVICEALVDNRPVDKWYRGTVAFCQQKQLAYISGAVILDQVPVEGVRVLCFPEGAKGFVGETLTDSSGAYRFEVESGKLYSLLVEYTDSEGKYRSFSHWGIEPKEI
jgi:hypothetical protein